MNTDARAKARELLARAGGAGGAATPAAAGTASATTTSAGATSAGGAVGGSAGGGPAARPGAPGARRRTRLDDLPQVRLSMERDAELAAGLALLQAPNPFFRAHTGINGATIHLDDQELINFSSYNYLGLADHPRVAGAAKAAIDEYGTTTGAARSVSGNIPLHEQLEAKIAECYDTGGATLVGSGFLTNAAVIAYVLGEKDLAVCDALVHNSIVAGTQWAHAQRMQFRHNDPDSLDALLRRTRSHFENVMVILEGVYSMDGDICRLPELIEVARRHDALVMVDEAHSFGVLGERGLGVREHFGLPGDAADIWMGTLSKTMSSHGGFVAGSKDFTLACRNWAPGMTLYAASATPANTAAALASVHVMLEEPERLARLRANAELFLARAVEAGLNTGPAQGTPIVPVVLDTSPRTVTVAVRLAEQGVNVNPILAPAVPEGQDRLRFFLCSEHTPEQIEYTVETLAKIVSEL